MADREKQLPVLEQLLFNTTTLSDGERQLLTNRTGGRGRREFPRAELAPMAVIQARAPRPPSPNLSAEIGNVRRGTPKQSQAQAAETKPKSALDVVASRRPGAKYRMLSNGKAQLVANTATTTPVLRETSKPIRIRQITLPKHSDLDEIPEKNKSDYAPESVVDTSGRDEGSKTASFRGDAKRQLRSASRRWQASMEAFTLELLTHFDTERLSALRNRFRALSDYIDVTDFVGIMLPMLSKAQQGESRPTRKPEAAANRSNLGRGISGMKNKESGVSFSQNSSTAKETAAVVSFRAGTGSGSSSANSSRTFTGESFTFAACKRPSASLVRLVEQIVELFTQVDVHGTGWIDWTAFSSHLHQALLGSFDSASRRLIKIGIAHNEPSRGCTCDCGVVLKLWHRARPFYRRLSARHGPDQSRFRQDQCVEKLLYIAPLDLLLLAETPDNVVSVYHASSREWSHQLRGHTAEVLAMTYIPEAGAAVTAGADRALCWWDATATALTAAWRLRERATAACSQLALCWCAETATLYSGGADGSILPWLHLTEALSESPTAPGVRMQPPMSAHRDAITAMLVPKMTKSLLVSASLDGTVRVLDVSSRSPRLIHVLKGHERAVVAVAYSDWCKLLFSAGVDHELRVWNPFSEATIACLRAHDAPLVAVEAMASTPQLFSADSAGIVNVWDVRSLTRVQTLRASAGALCTALALLPLHSRLVVAARRLTVFTEGEREGEHDATAAADSATRAVYNATNHTFVTCSGADVTVWDAHDGSLQRTFASAGTSSITCLSLDARGRKLFVADDEGWVRVIDLRTGLRMLSLRAHSAEVCAFMFEERTRVLVTASWDQTLAMHCEASEVGGGGSTAAGAGGAGPSAASARGAGGGAPERAGLRAGVRGSADVVRGGSWRGGEAGGEEGGGVLLRRVPTQHGCDVTCACLSATFSLVATGADDGSLQVWVIDEKGSPAPRARLRKHTASITALAFLDPSPLLVSADATGKVHLWTTAVAGLSAAILRYRHLTSMRASPREGVELKRRQRTAKVLMPELLLGDWRPKTASDVAESRRASAASGSLSLSSPGLDQDIVPAGRDRSSKVLSPSRLSPNTDSRSSSKHWKVAAEMMFQRRQSLEDDESFEDDVEPSTQNARRSSAAQQAAATVSTGRGLSTCASQSSQVSCAKSYASETTTDSSLSERNGAAADEGVRFNCDEKAEAMAQKPEMQRLRSSVMSLMAGSFLTQGDDADPDSDGDGDDGVPENAHVQQAATFSTVAVTALAYLPDASLFCWGDDLGRICTWDMSRILSTLPQGDGTAVCDNLQRLHGATATVVSYWQAHSSTVSSLHAISYPPSLLSSGSDGAKLWTPDGAVCYGTLRRSNADLGTRVWSFPEVEDVKEKQLKTQALQVLERLSSSEAQRLHSNLNQTGPSASFKEAAHAKLDRSLLSFSTPKDPTHARSAIIRDGGSLPSVLDIINEKSPGKDGGSARGAAPAADASPPPLHLDLSVSLSARSSSEGFRYGGGRRSHAAAAATAAALSPRASLLSPRRAGGGGTSPLPHGNEAAAAAAERLEKLLAG